MKWTKTKPTKPGYYFYRDEQTDHDVVTVDYDLYENLSYWEEWTKSWVPVICCPDDAEWSNVAIEFPEEPKKENRWLNYGKEEEV